MRGGTAPGIRPGPHSPALRGVLSRGNSRRSRSRCAQELGKQLVYPRVDLVARRLTLHPVGDLVADFRPGALMIPEPRPELPEWPPSAVDWVLVPGLAFDERGFRVGPGGGIL